MITPLPALLEENPIIIAIKDEEGLARCLQNPKPVVFVLYGSVVSIPDIVRRLKKAGKTVFVDVDLLDGLSAREAAVEYLVGATEADGVISTKAALVRRAKALGLAGVYRTFLLDNMALQSLRKSGGSQWADFIEILPGLMPKLIARLSHELNAPLIASGLIADKQDVIDALGAGAVAVSSTCPAVWGCEHSFFKKTQKRSPASGFAGRSPFLLFCRGGSALRLALDLDAAGGGGYLALLGQSQLQNAVVVGGLDGGGVDAAHVEAPAEGTELPFPAHVVAFFVLLAALGVVAGGDHQVIAVQVDGDVLLVEAGQLRLHQVGIALILNVAAELAHIAETGEQAALHVIQIVEQTVFFTAKRNHTKHKLLLCSAPFEMDFYCGSTVQFQVVKRAGKFFAE